MPEPENKENKEESGRQAQIMSNCPTLCEGVENAFWRDVFMALMRACRLGDKIKSASRVIRHILDEILGLTKECCRFLPLTGSIEMLIWRNKEMEKEK